MKIRRLIVALSCLLLLVGCGTKTELSADTFEKTMKDNEYSISDSSESVSYAESAYTAKKDGIKIAYVKGNKRYDIEGIFIDECKNIYLDAGEDYSKKTDGGDNWTMLEVSNDKNYYYIIWVDKTYFKITGKKKDKKEIKNIVRKLGY